MEVVGDEDVADGVDAVGSDGHERADGEGGESHGEVPLDEDAIHLNTHGLVVAGLDEIASAEDRAERLLGYHTMDDRVEREAGVDEKEAQGKTDGHTLPSY